MSFEFYSVKDLSDLSKGKRLLEILSLNGLIVEKAGSHEPIKEVFVESKLPIMWKGVGINEMLSAYFLFKGQKEVKFSGMVTWNTNLPPNTKAFNGINLWLNTPKNYDIKRLVQLGDDIFTWSEAIYGYITEDSKDLSTGMPGNIHRGLPGLMWVNYFGTPYLTEPHFKIPGNHVPVSHGERINLSEAPNDEILSDSIIRESIQHDIGVEWFWHQPRKYNIRVPRFDKSAITRR